MNILLSAYSFRPNSGSEPGVAWSFAVELAKSNTVYVLTRANSKKAIEDELSTSYLRDKIKVFYFDIPLINKWYKSATISEHIYYFFWQIALPLIAGKVLKNHKIDLIHHITLGAFRIPSFLSFYNKPFIFGPVGGGENFPYQIKKSFSAKLIFNELVRDAINKISVFNPFLLYTFHKSSLIICRTKETLNLIPAWYHYKCMIEIGIAAKVAKEIDPDSLPTNKQAPLKILYAGRPIYWKGLHLVIQAYAKALPQCPDIEFTVIGPGDTSWAREIAGKHQVDDKIKWLGRVDTDTLDHLYHTSDILMFPSLREAGGMVAVEALVYSLPVLCLNLGGPSQIVNNEWGIVLETEGKDQAQLVDAIADKMMSLSFNREPLHTMRLNAPREAQSYSIDRIVDRIYTHQIIRGLVGEAVHVG